MIRRVDGAGWEPPVEAKVERLERAESSAAGSFRDVLVKMRETEKETDKWVERALGRGMADPQELLRLQVVVHRFQYQIELASRVVDLASQAVRTLTKPT